MIQVLFDHHGNQYCGVNNFAQKLQTAFLSTKDFTQYNILNIHYPIQSLQYSLYIILYALWHKLIYRNKKLVLTLHEYHTSSNLRKISAKPLIALADAIVVTNEQEYNILSALNKNLEIIPIFANIKCKEIESEKNCHQRRILFFGNFYPARKIDLIIQEFLNFDNDMYELFICGSPNERHIEYFEKIQSMIEHHDNILIKTNVSEEEICQIASDSMCAISIYEDGLSAKRTSALMFFAMGLPLISNQGKNTEMMFIGNHHYCAFEGFEKSIQFLSNKNNYTMISENATSLYNQHFSNQSIVERYKKVFNNVS